MDLISIIVPVYNVAPYLDRCVRSIVDQTYQELEIILIDDGSTDTSGAICDQWAKQDARIKVIHKKNKGLSDARNIGIQAATGEFIAYVDSDDWVHPQFLELLHFHLTTNEADLAECCYVKTVQPVPVSLEMIHANSFNTLQALRLHIQDKKFQQVVWNKLYRRSLIQISFPQGTYHEDEFWTYRVLVNCKKLVHIDVVLYYYFQRSGSIMGTSYSNRNLDAVSAKLERLAFLSPLFPELTDDCEQSLFFTCLYHGQQSLSSLSGQDLSDCLNYLSDTVRFHPLSDPSKMPFHHLIWYHMAKRSLKVTCKFRNILKIGL